MEEIKCKTCGKLFQPQRKTAKYCSDTCRYHDFLTKKKRITIPRDLRYSILMRDNFRCQYCGATPQTKELRVDHIVSIKEGGAVTDPSNLITACDPCNAGKGEPFKIVVSGVGSAVAGWLVYETTGS